MSVPRGYNEIMNQLDRMFPEKLLLDVSDIKMVSGFKSNSSVYEYFTLHHGRANKDTVAMDICRWQSKQRRKKVQA